MDIKDAIQLISGAFPVSAQPSIWADLGCGDGLFTRALASLLVAGSDIYAVDMKPGIPAQLFNNVSIKTVQADFVANDLPLPPLDGLLMANSLHYVHDKQTFLRKIRPAFRHAPCMLIVTDTPVPRWVPYPVSLRSLKQLWHDADVTELGGLPSKFGGKMYAAMVRFSLD